jgi:hypothetical protein
MLEIINACISCELAISFSMHQAFSLFFYITQNNIDTHKHSQTLTSILLERHPLYFKPFLLKTILLDTLTEDNVT